MTPALVLASTSQYRRQLLDRLGVPFSVVAPECDETPRLHEAPPDTALRLAEAKARSVAAQAGDGLVIGCDQVANHRGRAVGKPSDRGDALRQLRMMRGETVTFHTALCLLNTRTCRSQLSLVDVKSTFRRFPDDALNRYLDRDLPFDCAGSARAEALGIVLFSAIESDDPTALIGLPLIRLTDMLLAEGFVIL